MLLSSATPAPIASAADLTSSSAVCNVTMTLTFTPPLTLLPGAGGFSVSGTGTCIGPGGGTLSLTGSSAGLTGLAADCAGIAATGSAMITLPFWSGTVSLLIAGPTAAQSWTLLNSGSPSAVVATGVMAWDSTSEIRACATGGTGTMTLTGVMTVVA